MQADLPGIRTRIRPFLKWPGGKRRLAGRIMAAFPPKFGTYWEPFLGGGAVFFAARHLPANLSDVNEELIKTYRAVRDFPGMVVKLLHQHAERHCEDHYREVRHAAPHTSSGVAARMIYLNRAGFNGLYRVNRAGLFNVPYAETEGRETKQGLRFLEDYLLHRAGAALRRASIRACTFSAIDPRPGDLVYCDPPYDGGFTAYTAAGFDAKDQEKLADLLRSWSSAGVHVVASNRDTPLVRALYPPKYFRLETLRHSHIIGGGAGREGDELLITGKGTR